MGQQKTKLDSTLGTKSSWIFNCNRVTRRLNKSDAKSSLFMTPGLNYLVLTKEMLTRDDPRRLDASPIGTKLYLPFEADSPEKGGRTILIHHPQLPSFLAETLGLKEGDTFENDLTILRTIDELPTLDGFLLRDALSLEGISVNEEYFEVSPEERGAIQKFIRGKMELLVRAAFGGAKTDPSKVTQLIDKVWEAKDLRALEPLIAALRCPNGEALAMFAAWKGIMFYSFDYFRSEEGRKALALWLNKNSNPSLGLPKEYAQYIRERVQGVIQRVRHHWVSVDTVLKQYNQLYDNFVTSMNPAGVIDFLRNAQETSCSVGVSLGKMSQAIGCLEMMAKTSQSGISEQNFDLLLGQLMAALAPVTKLKAQAA